MFLNKVLTILFVILLLTKYGFNKKIHEKYFLGIIALFLLSNTFGNKYSAIEMFDGSSIAFDKEAFENLNRVVNEIAGEGKLTVPGNLNVQGNVTVDGTTVFNNDCSIKGNKSLIVEGKGSVKLNNQSLTGDTNWGVRANKFVGDQFVCNGNKTLMDKTNGLKTNKKLEVTGTSTCNGPVTVNNLIKVKGVSTFDADVYAKRLIPGVIKSSTTHGSFTNGNVNPIPIQCGLTVAKPIKVTSIGDQSSNELIRYDDWISIAEGDTRLTRDKSEGWTHAMFANGPSADDKGYRRTMFKIVKGEDRPGNNKHFKDVGHNPAKTGNRK